MSSGRHTVFILLALSTLWLPTIRTKILLGESDLKKNLPRVNNVCLNLTDFISYLCMDEPFIAEVDNVTVE